MTSMVTLSVSAMSTISSFDSPLRNVRISVYYATKESVSHKQQLWIGEGKSYSFLLKDGPGLLQQLGAMLLHLFTQETKRGHEHSP